MVNLRRPGIDAPHQVLHVWESLLEEEGSRIGTPHAMVADGNDFCVPVQFPQGMGKACKRDQYRAIEFGQVIFPLLTDIEEDQLIALVESVLEFRRSDRVTHGLPPFPTR